jgi:hypothetical protein
MEKWLGQQVKSQYSGNVMNVLKQILEKYDVRV